MNHCHHDDDDNVSSLSTTIHIHEREHNGEPAWKCIDSAKHLLICSGFKPNFDHIKFLEELYRRTIMPYAILARD